MVAARQVNRAKYMPVAEDTDGSIPIPTNTGTKIRPGPIPHTAAAKAPKNDIATILTIF